MSQTTFDEQIESLYYPFFYNFFHAIELYCKWYLSVINGEFENKHNIQTLIDELVLLITDEDIILRLEKLKEQINTDMLIRQKLSH